jgi:hypothetical protein
MPTEVSQLFYINGMYSNFSDLISYSKILDNTIDNELPSDYQQFKANYQKEFSYSSNSRSNTLMEYAQYERENSGQVDNPLFMPLQHYASNSNDSASQSNESLTDSYSNNDDQPLNRDNEDIREPIGEIINSLPNSSSNDQQEIPPSASLKRPRGRPRKNKQTEDSNTPNKKRKRK